MRGVPNIPVPMCQCSRMNGCRRRQPVPQLPHDGALGLPAVNSSGHLNWMRPCNAPTETRTLERSFRQTSVTFSGERGYTAMDLSRAVELGLSCFHRGRGQRKRIENTGRPCGTDNSEALSLKLNRTHASIKGKVKELGLSVRSTKGIRRDESAAASGRKRQIDPVMAGAGWLRTVCGTYSGSERH